MEKRVLAFGAFDIIHPGHIFYLEKAKKLGSELIVVIGRDENIEFEKGHKPVHDEKTRLEVVKALKPVDKTVFGLKNPSKLKVIDKFQPDVIALGHDQKISIQEIRKYCKENQITAKIVRLPSYKRKKFKSSLSRKKVELDLDELFE